jgi:AcrR family transcriptional regulator
MTSTPPNIRGPYKKGVERREQILDQALIIFQVQGIKRTSLRAIAEPLGLTHSALKHYFTSIDDLLLAVLRRADDRARANAGLDGDFAATNFSRQLAEASMSLPGLTALFHTMTARAIESDDPNIRSYFVERYHRVRDFARVVLTTSQAAGTVRTDIPVDATAALLVAACDGLSIQWLIDPTMNMKGGLNVLDQLLRSTKRRIPET